MLFQAVALIFFMGQFYERQRSMDGEMSHIKGQHETMLSELAAIKQGQLDQDQRLERIERFEAAEHGDK